MTKNVMDGTGALAQDAGGPTARPDRQPGRAAGLDQPAGLTLAQVAAVSRVPLGSLRHARELGLLPAPDASTGRWSGPAVKQILEGWPKIATAVKAAQELGAVRCAEMLSRMTGLTVSRADVEALAGRGVLRPSRTYQRRPVYRVTDIQALAGDPFARALLAEIIEGH
ncbi:MAG TPA: hypothetical protein VKS82_23960 [Streptosporangiaceae bacterium]|nr:hypothetical protein [Streptosporangiaceae bacterium]